MKNTSEKDYLMTSEKAQEFNEIARNIFAPIYPAIAEKIVKHFGITSGVCIDLGCGPGHLAMAITEITEFSCFALDISESVITIAKENIKEAGLEKRIQTLRADTASLPFQDNSAELIISRGSVFFWDNLEEAFREIYRVLKPGGATAIGGGFGTEELREKVYKKMAERGEGFEKMVKNRLGNETIKNIEKKLELTLPGKYQIYKDDANLWFIIKK